MEEKKKRKVRSDKKYVYKKKNGKLQPYIPKRDRNDPLKIWWWREEPMKYKSIKRIPKKLRNTARKIIYVKDVRVDVHAEEISNKSKVEALALLTLKKDGTYLMMMFCHAKNKFGVAPKKVAQVVVRDGILGREAKLIKNYRLHRYWFWRGK